MYKYLKIVFMRAKSLFLVLVLAFINHAFCTCC